MLITPQQCDLVPFVPELPDIPVFLHPARSQAVRDTLKSLGNFFPHLFLHQMTEYSQSELVQVVKLKYEMLAAVLSLSQEGPGECLGFLVRLRGCAY